MEAKHTHSELEKQYRDIGYTDWHNEVDAEVAAESKCEQCGHTPRFIGLIKTNTFFGNSRIAIIHCDNCGWEEEF